MATEQEFWGRPLVPGRVRFDPNREAERARIVRAAVRHLATDPGMCETLPLADREACWRLAQVATDQTLAHLGRLLK